MSKPIIEVENLSKCYRIGANKEPYLSLRDEIVKFATRLRPRTKDQGQSETDFWALKDVSFNVQEGEAVGIIGRNGAGKSTLLKILSQITPPTEGKITLRGRVASLLEVGTGFHPELTGRENIYLNGAILGMSRSEIKRKFDEIVAFAEIEKFLDTPVKRYSSGMYVRLAFAVAAHLEPEILVVDEVLAVGDAQFQEKCLGKMEEVGKEGRTVLFVSHNMAAIKSLCKKAILLHKGIIWQSGTVDEVVPYYLGIGESCVNTSMSIQNCGDRILSLYAEDGEGNKTTAIMCGSELRIIIEYERRKLTGGAGFALDIYDLLGTRISYCNSFHTIGQYSRIEKRGVVECHFPRLPLIPGQYRILAALNSAEVSGWAESQVMITVLEGDFYGTGRLPIGGQRQAVFLDHEWKI